MGSSTSQEVDGNVTPRSFAAQLRCTSVQREALPTRRACSAQKQGKDTLPASLPVYPWLP